MDHFGIRPQGFLIEKIRGINSIDSVTLVNQSAEEECIFTAQNYSRISIIADLQLENTIWYFTIRWYKFGFDQ